MRIVFLFAAPEQHAVRHDGGHHALRGRVTASMCWTNIRSAFLPPSGCSRSGSAPGTPGRRVSSSWLNGGLVMTRSKRHQAADRRRAAGRPGCPRCASVGVGDAVQEHVHLGRWPTTPPSCSWPYSASVDGCRRRVSSTYCLDWMSMPPGAASGVVDAHAGLGGRAIRTIRRTTSRGV